MLHYETDKACKGIKQLYTQDQNPFFMLKGY